MCCYRLGKKKEIKEQNYSNKILAAEDALQDNDVNGAIKHIKKRLPLMKRRRMLIWDSLIHMHIIMTTARAMRILLKISTAEQSLAFDM